MKRRDVRRAPPKSKVFRVKEVIEMRVRPVEVPLRAASAGGGRFETKDITEYKVRWAGSKNNVNYEDEKFDTWVKKSALNPACLAQFHGEGAAAGPAVMLANMPVGDHPSSPGYQGALYLQAWTKQVTASHDGKPVEYSNGKLTPDAFGDKPTRVLVRWAAPFAQPEHDTWEPMPQSSSQELRACHTVSPNTP